MTFFETMAKLGGYILMFSIISACVSHFWFLPPGGKYIFFGMIEVKDLTDAQIRILRELVEVMKHTDATRS